MAATSPVELSYVLAGSGAIFGALSLWQICSEHAQQYPGFIRIVLRRAILVASLLYITSNLVQSQLRGNNDPHALVIIAQITRVLTNLVFHGSSLLISHITVKNCVHAMPTETVDVESVQKIKILFIGLFVFEVVLWCITIIISIVNNEWTYAVFIESWLTFSIVLVGFIMWQYLNMFRNHLEMIYSTSTLSAGTAATISSVHSGSRKLDSFVRFAAVVTLCFAVLATRHLLRAISQATNFGHIPYFGRPPEFDWQSVLYVPVFLVVLYYLFFVGRGSRTERRASRAASVATELRMPHVDDDDAEAAQYLNRGSEFDFCAHQEEESERRLDMKAALIAGE